MIFSALRQAQLLTAVVATGEKPEPSNTVVVVTGLVLVFAILILLTLILTIEGKVFASLDQKKKDSEQAASQPTAGAPVAVAPAAAPAPVVQEGIPPEVVAAITAAVAQIEGGRYTLRSVSATPQGRSQWGLAGVLSYTEPF